MVIRTAVGLLAWTRVFSIVLSRMGLPLLPSVLLCAAMSQVLKGYFVIRVCFLISTYPHSTYVLRSVSGGRCYRVSWILMAMPICGGVGVNSQPPFRLCG